MKVLRIEIAGPMKSKVFLENGEHIEGLTFISSEAACGGLTKFKIEGFILPVRELSPDAGKIEIVPSSRRTWRERLSDLWARVSE